MLADLHDWIDHHGERITRAELSSLVQGLTAVSASSEELSAAGGPGTPALKQGSRATPYAGTPYAGLSRVSSSSVPRAAAPVWRRAVAVALDLLPALAVWRYTYFSAPWAPSALLFGLTALSLPLLGAGPGQWLLGLRLWHGGRRTGFARGMLRFALCYAWFPAASAFFAAAYASSPYSSPLGLFAGALLVAWLASGLGVLTPQKAGLFDQLLGTAVVRR
jgi:hypothetical protein